MELNHFSAIALFCPIYRVDLSVLFLPDHNTNTAITTLMLPNRYTV